MKEKTHGLHGPQTDADPARGKADSGHRPNTAYNGIDIYGNPDNASLIPQGWQRAGALIKLFTSSSGSFPVPQFLFAPNQFGNGTSKRPYETITPLSQKLGISINPAQAQYSN